MNARLLAAATAAALLTGCAALPEYPSVPARPGSYKPYDRFAFEDAECRRAASLAVGGGDPGYSAQKRQVDSAVAGTAIGAVTGALIGSASGDAGPGAAIGAGLGLLYGGLAGSQPAYTDYYAQRQFDRVYLDCMYAHGNQVPMPARRIVRSTPPSAVPPGAVREPDANTRLPPGYVPAPR